MALTTEDRQLLRALAFELKRVSENPIWSENKAEWQRHNALEDGRPLFLVDQLPWNELDMRCTNEGALISDRYWKSVEIWLRREIWKATNLKTDMVVDPYIKLRIPYKNSGWGLKGQVTELKLDAKGDVASQHMACLINEPEDIKKIKLPVIEPMPEETDKIRETASELFYDVMPWRLNGDIMHLGAWDTIAYWMGVENIYIELMDRPEMMHAIMEKMTAGYLSMIDQFTKHRLYDTCENLCHCSQTYMRGEDDKRPVPADGWAFGLAQAFTSVSPKITEDFECAYMKRIFPHFRHIYYGCCDRLDDRMEIVSKLPNVRKISCSPWSHREAFAEKLPKSIIMSNKPSPAFLAGDSFEEDAVRKDIRRTIAAARKNGVRLEMILKDVSTVRYDVPRLQRFCEIATEEARLS